MCSYELSRAKGLGEYGGGGGGSEVCVNRKTYTCDEMTIQDQGSRNMQLLAVVGSLDC